MAAAKRTGRSSSTRKATARKRSKPNRYGRASEKRVASAMRRRKRGTLRSSSGAKVKSRKQAIAIGLSEARSKGGKVPARPRSGSRAKKKR